MTTRQAVIIGSGLGGLAAAIRLATRGWRVVVLEKQDAPGGRAGVFRQDGFTFDMGPPAIPAPFLFEELWALCGRRMADDVTLTPVDPFYRIRFDDGDWFDYSGDAARMREEVARISPGDVDGYGRFMEVSAALYHTAFKALGDVPFERFFDMARAAPALLKHQAHLSVYGLVSLFVRHEKIRRVLSFHPLMIGADPFAAGAVAALIAHMEHAHGMHAARGGTAAIVRALVGLIGSLGGALRYGAEVAEICVEGGAAVGVRLAGGERVPADIVVSNADSAYTYRHLVAARHRRRWTDRRIERARYSHGVFVWHFGTAQRYAGVPHHSVLMGARFKALLADIFTHKVLPTDFLLHVHRHTAGDDGLAPHGCDAFTVVSPVPNLDGEIDWTLVGENYRRAIAHYLAETVLPGLRRNIVTSRVVTPADYAARLLALKGAGYGLAPTLGQSLWFRPHNRSEDVRNLFLVGAGTHPGGGVAGVLLSARVLDRVVPDAGEFASA